MVGVGLGGLDAECVPRVVVAWLDYAWISLDCLYIYSLRGSRNNSSNYRHIIFIFCDVQSAHSPAMWNMYRIYYTLN